MRRVKNIVVNNTIFGCTIPVRPSNGMKIKISDLVSLEVALKKAFMRNGMNEMNARLTTGFPLEFAVGLTKTVPAEDSYLTEVLRAMRRTCSTVYGVKGPVVYETLKSRLLKCASDARRRGKSRVASIQAEPIESRQHEEIREDRQESQDEVDEEEDDVIGIDGQLLTGETNAVDADQDDIYENSVADQNDLSAIMLQLAAEPGIIKDVSPKERKLASLVSQHQNEVLFIMQDVATNSDNEHLFKAVQAFQNMTSAELMERASTYEKAMGVSPGPRVLHNLMKEAINGNKSAAELEDYERDKFDNLTIKVTKNSVNGLVTYHTEFNKQAKVMSDFGKPLSNEELATKYVKALRNAAARDEGIKEAHKQTLQLVRKASQNGEEPPSVESLQGVARDCVELQLEIDKANKEKLEEEKKWSQTRIKSKERTSRPNREIDELSFYNKERGQGYNESYNKFFGSGKGKGKGSDSVTGFKGKVSGKGRKFKSGKGNGKDKGHGSSSGSERWEKSTISVDDRQLGDSEPEGNYRYRKLNKPQKTKSSKVSTLYSNAVDKVMQKDTKETMAAGRNGGWSEDQAEAFFTKMLTNFVEKNIQSEDEEASMATIFQRAAKNAARRCRNDRGAEEASDGESSVSSQSGWGW